MTPGRLKVWNGDADAWQYTPGGSQPSLAVAEITFAQVAGGGHTYTGTVDLPANSWLWFASLSVLTDWEGVGDDLPWTVGDEDAADNIYAQGQGFAGEGQPSYWDSIADKWNSGNPNSSVDFSNSALKPYPTGQTITVAVTDVIGGSGTALVRVWYFVAAPTTTAAVVTP